MLFHLPYFNSFKVQHATLSPAFPLYLISEKITHYYPGAKNVEAKQKSSIIYKVIVYLRKDWKYCDGILGLTDH